MDSRVLYNASCGKGNSFLHKLWNNSKLFYNLNSVVTFQIHLLQLWKDHWLGILNIEHIEFGLAIQIC